MLKRISLRVLRRVLLIKASGEGDEMEPQDPSPEIEVYKAVRAHELELNRATAGFEHAVLTPLFLLNGGALVAFLTLLGAVSPEGPISIEISSARTASLLWAVGLLVAAMAAYCGYRAQQHLSRAERLRRQEVERLLTISEGLKNIVAKPDSKSRTTKKEIEKAGKWQFAYGIAIGTSVVAFLVGAVMGASSVQLL